MSNNPYHKKLSHRITREGSEYPFRNDYTYKFSCTQFLEKIDNFEGFSSMTYNEMKEILVDQLTHEFKCNLNSIIFGDPAGKGYVESLKQKENGNDI